MASLKYQDIRLPECMMCGQLMSFDGREDAEPGFEIQTSSANAVIRWGK